MIKHFDYDAMITGSSMVANFRTSELDELFGTDSIKVTFNGGSYKEVNDNIKNALDANPDLKMVVRCLDMSCFLSAHDDMRDMPETYPTYLYDKNPFNDVKFLFNRDVVFGRTLRMITDKSKEDFETGISAFDNYSRWQSLFTFGINTVCPDGIIETETNQVHLSDAEKEKIRKNIELNVTDTADANPDVDFYYFYSPYSLAAWNDWKTEGNLLKMLEAEAYITELIIPHSNIHLFSFNSRTDINGDLNNYKDSAHYAIWVNSMVLKWMHDGNGLLTPENYVDRLKEEYDFFTGFDYESLNGQEDYEADYYAAALLNEELTGVKSLDVVDDGRAEYAREKEFSGIRFVVDLEKGYNYLCFDGQKMKDSAELHAIAYDETNEVVAEMEVSPEETDDRIHHYALDLSTAHGTVTVELNGAYTETVHISDPDYMFSNIFFINFRNDINSFAYWHV